MKLFCVSFDSIVQDKLSGVPIPRDWLVTSAYGELEAFAENLPMGSSCICRRGCDYIGTEHAIQNQLKGSMYDTARYEECRVLISFPDGARPIADLLYTLEVLAYTGSWSEAILMHGVNCRARDFVTSRGAYIRDLLYQQTASFGAYWRDEHQNILSET